MAALFLLLKTNSSYNLNVFGINMKRLNKICYYPLKIKKCFFLFYDFGKFKRDTYIWIYV